MALLEKVPITKLEKWINRIVTIALAVWQFIEQVVNNWNQ